MLAFSILLGAAFCPLQGQTSSTSTPPESPNAPGILDPVVVELERLPFRLGATDQVVGDSELVNLVGKVRRKKARGSRSATGALIQDNRSVTENVDRSLEDMVEAAVQGDGADMRAAAAQLQHFLLGTSAGFISDGFPLLHHYQGGFFADHLPGEYRLKRATRSGHTFVDEQGVSRDYWQVTWRLLWTEAGAESDLAFLEIPMEAAPEDRLLIHFEVYASVSDDVGLMSFVRDSNLQTADGLPFKGLDTTWVRVRKDEIHEFSVDHGTLATLREIGIRGSSVRPEPLARVDLIREVFDVHAQSVVREARGQALTAAARRANSDSLADEAPEVKILQLALAASGGASPQQIATAALAPDTAPLGTWQEWSSLLANRNQLPREALDLLASEGITPGAQRDQPLGPYDFVAVKMNHEWYGLSARATLMPFAPPIDLATTQQGATQTLKVINFDHEVEGLQVTDYGPALLDDIGTCYNAPHGWKSLEIFSDKPLWGFPKAAELYWRTGWGFRPHAGVIAQYDLFPRPRDRASLTRFTDSFGVRRQGWQYPTALRGGDFRVNPPLGMVSQPGRPALHEWREIDGQPGLVIGATTPGYGDASMPAFDLSAMHPSGLVNTDTDGDFIPDQLLFPDWLRNPDPLGGDVLLSSPEWTPFLYLNPNNGTVWIDPAQPQLGLWAHKTYALGAPLAAGESRRIDWVRPRALGQAVWLDSGAVRAFGGLPLTMLY